MGLLPPFVGAIIFCILQFIVFLFVLVSTPIDQLKSRHSDECWTFFGSKKRCSDAKRQSTGTAAFGCVRRRDNMSAGGAFAIISIFSTLAAFVFGVLMLVRIPCAVLIPLLLTCFSVVTILISWACIAGVYGEKMCGSEVWKSTKASEYMHYGAGFGLMVTAWCLQVINVVVLVLVSFF